MLTIKSNPAYSVTMKVDIDGEERTMTACDLDIADAMMLDMMTNEDQLNTFLDHRFPKYFCESLVGIPLGQAQDAQLAKEYIAKSFAPGYEAGQPINISDDFDNFFIEVANVLKSRSIIKIHYDFNSENIRMIEPTKIGNIIINFLFGGK